MAQIFRWSHVCTVLFNRHPDKNQGNEEVAGENFKRVFEAHQRMLRDTDGSQDEEEFDDEDYEAAMEEALAFYIFMCAVGSWCAVCIHKTTILVSVAAGTQESCHF